MFQRRFLYFINYYYHWFPISIHATSTHVTYNTTPLIPFADQHSLWHRRIWKTSAQWFSFFCAVYCLTITLWLLAPFHKTELTETSISDNLVSIITLLSMLGLHLSIPTHANSVWDFLRGLERLEGLEKSREKTNSVSENLKSYLTRWFDGKQDISVRS